MTCHQLLSLKNWLTPELKKKKVFAVCVNVLQRTSIKIRGSWRITTQLKKFLCNNQFYWNEMKFLSPWKLRLIFKSSIWSILSTSLMVSLGVQLNCLFSLPEMIAFSFPRIIYFNFVQMKAGVFSQRCSSSRILETPSLNLDNPVRDTLISTKERRIKLTW